jgi:hypothetical protein
MEKENPVNETFERVTERHGKTEVSVKHFYRRTSRRGAKRERVTKVCYRMAAKYSRFVKKMKNIRVSEKSRKAKKTGG